MEESPLERKKNAESFCEMGSSSQGFNRSILWDFLAGQKSLSLCKLMYVLAGFCFFPNSIICSLSSEE